MSEDEQDEGERRASRLQVIDAASTAAGGADADTSVKLQEALGLYRGELDLFEADSSDCEDFVG